MYSIREQTGWKRPFPKQICQERDVLLKITKFNYDINDKKFILYVRSRTGIVLDLALLSEDRRRKEEEDRRNKGLEDYWENSKKLFDKDSVVEETWMKITKSKIQDCWELYNEG